MRKIRILQVIDNMSLGGAQGMIINLMRAFDPEAFEARLVSLYGRIGTHHESALEAEGIEVEYLGKGVGAALDVPFKVDRILRRFRPDVVHTHLRTFYYSLVPSVLRRVPVRVHTIHSLADREAASPHMMRIAFALGMQPVSIADMVSDSIRDLYGLENTPCIPNGIPVDLYRRGRISRDAWRSAEGIPVDCVLFVHVARFEDVKNHRFLIDSFARESAHGPHAHLALVGGGDLESTIRGQVRERGLQSRVHFLGRRSDVPDILAASDVLLLPSKWEGNPLSIMEGHAAGLPVVASHVGGIPQLVQHERSGILFPVDDEDAFVAALRRVVDDPELRTRMSAEATRRAETLFDARVMARAYEDLYRRLLKARGAPGAEDGA